MSKRQETDNRLPRYQDFSTESAFDRIIFEDLDNSEDAYLVALAEELINGHPLVINFEKLIVDEANKVVAFLSGVMFAVGGIVEKINSRVFLFSRAQEYKDGTLKQFINEYKEV